jgi:hypothetical protein
MLKELKSCEVVKLMLKSIARETILSKMKKEKKTRTNETERNQIEEKRKHNTRTQPRSV